MNADWSSITTTLPTPKAGSKPPPPIWIKPPATCARNPSPKAWSCRFEGYVIFKDYVTHLEYIRSCEELWGKGLYVEAGAYQHHVFMDWRFVWDENGGFMTR